MPTPSPAARAAAARGDAGTSCGSPAARRPESGAGSGRPPWSVRWRPLLLALVLAPLLGGGCVFHYQSNNDDDDDDDDDDGGTTVIVTATAAEDGAANAGAAAAQPGGEGAPAAEGPATLVLLQELPDIDGDGEPEFALLVADGGSPELPASAWLLSGRDGRVLEQRVLGALSPRVERGPARATAQPAAPPSAPTTSAPPARARAPAAGPAPRRE